MGISERKERERESRRSAIVKAAENVFFSKGLALATMDDVAEEAELSKGTLYLYFKSKNELYMAIAERGLGMLLELFHQARHPEQTGREQLRNIGEAYFEFARRYPDHYKANTYFEMHDLESELVGSEVTKACQEIGNTLIQQTNRIIEKGIADGSINTTLDPTELTILLWSSMRGIIQLYHMRHRGHQMPALMELNFDALSHQFIHLILEGVRHKPEPPIDLHLLSSQIAIPHEER
jgi:AcrR family transcriptional regulator